MTNEQHRFGFHPIRWMVNNQVASNLLMFVLIIGGLIVGSQVKQEIFPEFELDIVRVTVPYPGASPEEVERGIIYAIEDEVRGIDGLKEMKSIADEGQGTVSIELLEGADPGKALQDVKNAVDSILSFPEEAERPVVSLLEARRQVISLVIYGDLNELTLRKLAEKMRDDMLQLPGITQVDLAAVPPLEISVEVPQRILRKYNLTLDAIAMAIRRTALELPGGGVKTPGGEVLLRTKERRDYAEDFADIPIISNPDGSKIYLEDIANIQEIFEETDEEAFYDGKRAIRLDVFRVGEQTPISISKDVKEYIEQANKILPKGVQLTVWNDQAEIYRDRITLLLKNALLGLFLVLLLLGLFLEPRLAFWVTLGIPISIIGSFIFIPLMGASINMVSLFAFIVTLGIIVDDAIIVGENIFHKREQGLHYDEAAVQGAEQISGPVVFAVLTNIVAFIPLFFVPGSTGKIFIQIPAIVVSVFIISLVESLFVLPAHLSHRYTHAGLWKHLDKPSTWFNGVMRSFIENVYFPNLKTVLHFRYISVSIGIALLVLTLAVVYAGYVQFSYLPRVDTDLATAQVVMPFGVPKETSRQVQNQLVQAAREAIAGNGGESISRGIYTQIGSPVTGVGPALGDSVAGKGSHLIGTQVFLVPSNQRNISGVEFAKKWREKAGAIKGAETVSYNASIGVGGGAAIDFELSHPSITTLEQAAEELGAILGTYQGVSDIDDGVSLGKPQMTFRLRPEGRSLGITVNDLARQVRAAFYGSEALRQQRGRNEMKIMVRLPEKERETINSVESLVLRTPQGGEILLSEASDVDLGRSYTRIRRSEGRRVLSVTADVDESKGNANQIVSDIEKNVLPKLMQKYSGLNYRISGEQEEQRESLDALKIGFAFALVIIYTLLAIPFKSYLQPLIVMMSIPFGMIGAVIGHVLLGYELSIMSMFGVIALAGVVVNDALVLVVTTNNRREETGCSPFDALLYSGPQRFRPIILTSLTTFFGLAPMIFETSVQARFLIPMAISLGFGVLFATFITLLIVPSLYLILEDFKRKTI